MAKLPDFDGLAFPVITVRLANHKGRASVERSGGEVRRATLNYTYDQPDGERFAVKVARKLWDEVAASDTEDGYTPDPVILVPGNAGAGKGYMFTAVPVRFFQ